MYGAILVLTLSSSPAGPSQYPIEPDWPIEIEPAWRYPTAAQLSFDLSRVDHILMGARQDSLMRKLLGSVSARVAAEATCTVTVVRPSRIA